LLRKQQTVLGDYFLPQLVLLCMHPTNWNLVQQSADHVCAEMRWSRFPKSQQIRPFGYLCRLAPTREFLDSPLIATPCTTRGAVTGGLTAETFCVASETRQYPEVRLNGSAAQYDMERVEKRNCPGTCHPADSVTVRHFPFPVSSINMQSYPLRQIYKNRMFTSTLRTWETQARDSTVTFRTAHEHACCSVPLHNACHFQSFSRGVMVPLPSVLSRR